MNAVPTILEPSKPYDREQSSKRQKGRTLVQIQIEEKEFAIDQDDYNAIKAIRSPMSWKRGGGGNDQDWVFSFHLGREEYSRKRRDIRSVSETASALNSTLSSKPNRLTFEFDLNDEKRVSCLEIGRDLSYYFVGNLPDEVLSLSALKKLCVCDSALISIPPDITQLKNLEDLELINLQLDYTRGNIPDCIGNLNLKRLCLIHLDTLPPSIGKLTNLEELKIIYGPIQELPDEIRNLSALRRLMLYDTSVSITSSIRRLQNLEEIQLTLKEGWDRFVDHNAIEDIGHLVNLKKMRLGCQSGQENLMTFPSCMGNLHQLEWLCLDNVKLFPLPKLEIMRKLSNLKTFFYDYYSREDLEFMLDLAQACPRLGDVYDFVEERRPKLKYALACNRFKFQTNFGCGHDEFSPLLCKLWPRMLSNPTLGFRHYRKKPGLYSRIKPHDALYKLLLDGREFFIQALLHCNSGST